MVKESLKIKQPKKTATKQTEKIPSRREGEDISVQFPQNDPQVELLSTQEEVNEAEESEPDEESDGEQEDLQAEVQSLHLDDPQLEEISRPLLSKRPRNDYSDKNLTSLIPDRKEMSMEQGEEIVMIKRPKPSAATNGTVLISEPDIMLKVLDYNGVSKFKEEWNIITPEVRKCMDMAQHIAPELHPILDTIPPVGIKNPGEWIPTTTGAWRNYSDEEVFHQFLINWLPRSNKKNQIGQTAEERLLSLQIMNFKGMCIKPIINFLAKFFREFNTWESEMYQLNPEEKKRKTGKIISEILKATKKKSLEKSVTYELVTSLELLGTFTDPRHFGSALLAKAKDIICNVAFAIKIGMVASGFSSNEQDNSRGNGGSNRSKGTNRSRDNNTARSSINRSQNSSKQTTNASSDQLCNGCGRTNHSYPECELNQHPDFNTDRNIPWSESANGKAWAAVKNRDGKPFLVLPRKLTLAMAKQWQNNSSGTTTGDKQNKGGFRATKHYNKTKCESLLALTTDFSLTYLYPIPYIRGEIRSVSGNELDQPISVKII